MYPSLCLYQSVTRPMRKWGLILAMTWPINPAPSRAEDLKTTSYRCRVLEEQTFYLQRWRLNPEYNPKNPRCLMIFFAVLKVPLFWYEAATALVALAFAGSDMLVALILDALPSAIRTETWALSLVNSKGPILRQKIHVAPKGGTYKQQV